MTTEITRMIVRIDSAPEVRALEVIARFYASRSPTPADIPLPGVDHETMSEALRLAKQITAQLKVTQA